MTQEFHIVDAFTSVPFKGNAAAVCVMDSFLDDAALQRIAAQMNLSETAFLVSTAPLAYDLRWFTPEVEVNLCGHATLAATHVLLQKGLIAKGDTVTYRTQSGELKAKALDHGIELDFPALPGAPVTPEAALKALGVEILACWRNRDNDLVEVRDYETLTACRPSFRRLAKMTMQGVIVTTATNVPGGFDFASRYFCPQIGIDEDPVTGSAHCFLAPYWAEKLGKTRFRALQASKGHGILDLAWEGTRVKIAGHCVTALRGAIPVLSPSNPKKAAAC